MQSEREDWGRLGENAVYLELKRRNKQVCYSDLENQETRDREINALLECLKALELSSGKILTFSLKNALLMEGRTIHLIPLYQWLSVDESQI